MSVRLACVRHAASVHPEPGSNSHVQSLCSDSASFSLTSSLPFLLFKVLFSEFLPDRIPYILFILESFRVALLFICQGSVVASQQQLIYLITSRFVCQQLF